MVYRYLLISDEKRLSAKGLSCSVFESQRLIDIEAGRCIVHVVRGKCEEHYHTLRVVRAREIVLPRTWAERATLMLLLAAQALERVEPPPSLAVPVTLAGTLAFGAGLTVGWILWGLSPREGDTHA